MHVYFTYYITYYIITYYYFKEICNKKELYMLYIIITHVYVYNFAMFEGLKGNAFVKYRYTPVFFGWYGCWLF